MRQCPECGSPIRFLFFAYPRLSRTFQCPNCRSTIKSGGSIVRASDASLLLISFGVYSAITGNFAQGVAMLPIILVATYLEYRYANVTVLERIPPQ